MPKSYKKGFLPVEIENAKWINEGEICSDCFKFLHWNRTIFIDIVNLEDSLTTNKRENICKFKVNINPSSGYW